MELAETLTTTEARPRRLQPLLLRRYLALTQLIDFPLFYHTCIQSSPFYHWVVNCNESPWLSSISALSIGINFFVFLPSFYFIRLFDFGVKQNAAAASLLQGGKQQQQQQPKKRKVKGFQPRRNRGEASASESEEEEADEDEDCDWYQREHELLLFGASAISTEDFA